MRELLGIKETFPGLEVAQHRIKVSEVSSWRKHLNMLFTVDESQGC